MSNMIKKPDASDSNLSNARTAEGQIQIGVSKKDSLADRLRKQRELNLKAEANASIAKDRIALILDCSGSMSGQPIQLLKQAVSSFAQNIPNDGTCSVALVPFGTENGRNEVGPIRPLTVNKALLLTESQTFKAHGGTPMGDAMNITIRELSITRAVLVSDGFPDSPERALEACGPYIEMRTPIDTVHIGHGGGEQVLKDIAAKTGGIFMEFRDILSFSQAFKFLTPSGRLQLMTASEEDVKRLTGSDEVKR